jgi:thioester reductase-like protein
MMTVNQEVYDQAIAIIGMSGRFPGAKNLKEYWENLSNGVESTHFFTDEELLEEGVALSFLQDPAYIKAKPMIADVDMFDASFFGYTPKEAEILDPQQRIFLECAWEALESAGYIGDQAVKDRTAVFAGVGDTTYLLYHLLPNEELVNDVGFLTLKFTNDKDYLSTRVSYKLNLKGPSLTVQTACSTSLVAVHLACQSLLTGESDLALAGASSITFPHREGMYYQAGGITSPDGRCRAFDESAKGTIFGDGVGVVAIKRYSDAVADGDYIHAVIRGSAVNNDGFDKIGYTAPSVKGQVAVIREALAVSGVEPEMIEYIETHGTGTPLGDPIEMAALREVFAPNTSKEKIITIGAVKTNFGHLNTAAGMAGLIKTVLAIQNGIIPPTLHYRKPNKELYIENSPFEINTQPKQWVSADLRRAGVSAFGVGGTNAHIVVEEAREGKSQATRAEDYLLVWSAKTREALQETSANLIRTLKAQQDRLAEIAYTLQVGRIEYEHRAAIRCKTTEEAIEKMQALLDRGASSQDAAVVRQPVFVFQQRANGFIGRELKGMYLSSSMFRKLWDELALELLHYCDLDVRLEILDDKRELSDTWRWVVGNAADYIMGKILLELGVGTPLCVSKSTEKHYGPICLEYQLSLKDTAKLLAVTAAAECGLPYRIDGEQKRITIWKRDGKPDEVHLDRIGGWEAEWRKEADLRISSDSQSSYYIYLSAPHSEMTDEELPFGPNRAHMVSRFSEEENNEAIGRLWVNGVEIDWKVYNNGREVCRRIPVPTYPFQRKSYMVERPKKKIETTPEGYQMQYYPRPAQLIEYVEPENEIEAKLCTIFEKTLAIHPVGVTDNFFEMGGHSLLAVQLLTLIKEEYGMQLPTKILFLNPSAKQLALTVRNVLTDGIQSIQHLLERDKNRQEYDFELSVDGSSVEHYQFVDPRHIFLTGATGYLGAFVLAELLDQTDAQLHCLIRAGNNEEANRRVKGVMVKYGIWREEYANRIVSICGDLGDPLLGLDEIAFDTLSHKVDSIYHIGAWVNWIYPYETLEPANVFGTQEVIRLATKRRLKPVHFVSSVAVFDTDQFYGVDRVYEDDTIHNSDAFLTGYAESKWVAEQLVRMAAESGLPITIHRPAYISGHSISGVSNTVDFLYRMTKGCIELGMAPDLNVFVNIAPVDYVSKALVHISRQSSAIGKVYHLVHPKDILWLDVVEWLKRKGYNIEVVDYLAWRDKLGATREKTNALFPLLPIFADNADSGTEHTISVDNGEPHGRIFDCSNTSNELANNSVVCPDVGEELLDILLKYLVDNHYLESPQPIANVKT